MTEPVRVETTKVDPVLREVLSPKALNVLRTVLAYGELGRRHSEELESAKEEVFSEDDWVWACADGTGYVRALLIDDDAIAQYSAEELEDVISDVLIEASERGKATGMEIMERQQQASAEFFEQVKDLI